MKKITTNVHNRVTYTGKSPWTDIKESDLSPEIIMTDLQQCIKDCLKLATFAGSEALTPYARQEELSRLHNILSRTFQKELDSWKAIMGGETLNKESGVPSSGGSSGIQGPIGAPGSPPIGAPGSPTTYKW